VGHSSSNFAQVLRERQHHGAATEGKSDRLLGAEANQRLARGLKINLSFSPSEMAAKIRISGIN
jgi:hypothetical protein